MDLRQALRLVRRWWWLLLLAPLSVGAAATFYGRYADANRQTVYTASARILVNPPPEGAPDYRVETFASLLQPVPDPVLEQVITDLALPFALDELRAKVSGFGIEGSDVLVVTATDRVPQRAADIANAVGRRFSEFVASSALAFTNVTAELLDSQIAEAEDRVQQTERQIAGIEAEAEANAQRPATLLNLGGQLQAQNAELNRRRDTLAGLVRQRQERERLGVVVGSILTVAVAAELPTTASSGRAIFVPLLGAFVGLALAGGLILFLAYLDTTVGAGADFATLTGAPLLSMIPRVPRLRSGRRQLFVIDRPSAPASEAIRLLRTNLEFAATTEEFRSLVVSSPGRGEGKSTIVANLAVAMAQAGFKTVVIDADLRNPSQHQIFEIPNARGLTTLLARMDDDWRSVAVDVAVRNLLLLPSGPLPANPADLLSLDRLPRLLSVMGRTTDIVLIDTPPVLSVSDSLVVAADSDGVVLVCRSGRTRHDALRRAAAAFERGTVRIVGAVLNHRTARDEGEFVGAREDRQAARVQGAHRVLRRPPPRRGRRVTHARMPRVGHPVDDQPVAPGNGLPDHGAVDAPVPVVKRSPRS